LELPNLITLLWIIGAWQTRDLKTATMAVLKMEISNEKKPVGKN